MGRIELYFDSPSASSRMKKPEKRSPLRIFRFFWGCPMLLLLSYARLFDTILQQQLIHRQYSGLHYTSLQLFDITKFSLTEEQNKL